MGIFNAMKKSKIRNKMSTIGSTDAMFQGTCLTSKHSGTL